MDYIFEGFRVAVYLLLTGSPETYSAVAATLKVSAMSMSVSLALGIPLGFALGYASFPGRRPLRFVMETLMALPTVLVGLLVYGFITRRGPLGNLGLLFTLPGIAIGQAILAVPIVSSLTAAAVEGLDGRLRQTLLTLGANRFQLALGSFHEARYQIMLASMNAFGRVTTEVGISMMLGGNIKWETRTITTAITLETGKGEFGMGIALGLVLLLIAFLVNAGLALLRRKASL